MMARKARGPLPRRPSESLGALPEREPGFVAPMECAPVAELPDDAATWIYEPKLDGYRCCAVVRNNRTAVLHSRQGNQWTDRFVMIREELARLACPMVLDGEIVALDPRGRPSFQELQNWQRTKLPIVFYAFDITNLDGHDLRHLPLIRRKAILADVASSFRYPVLVSAAPETDLETMTVTLRELGLEGIVAKKRASPYLAGIRSPAWQKRRFNETAELLVGGYLGGDDSSFRLLVGVMDERGLRFVKKLKNGFTPHLRRELLTLLRSFENGRNPFYNLPEPKGRSTIDAATMNEVKWVRVKLRVEVEFVEWTGAGKLRHAAFRRVADAQ
jgi:bifunctional non-homologous end joining protein LigD